MRLPGIRRPRRSASRFKEAGLIWLHKCVGVRYALKVQDMGADVVTVVGYENGGATGKLDVGTLVLVPRVVESLNVPVIGGGGVSDGRGVAALMALGAQGVIVGTRLLATKEAPLHDNLKQALLNASELDTMLVMRSIGATHRVWKNAAALRIAELESDQASLPEILNVATGEKAKRMYREGEIDLGIIACGQAIGMVHDIPTVKELFDRMMQQAGDCGQGPCRGLIPGITAPHHIYHVEGAWACPQEISRQFCPGSNRYGTGYDGAGNGYHHCIHRKSGRSFTAHPHQIHTAR